MKKQPNGLAHNVIRTIEQQKIKPTARWHFWCLNVLLGLLIILFFSLGSLASGMVFYVLHNLDFWDFLWSRPRVFLQLFWVGIPLLWIVIWGLLAVPGVLFLRQSPRGYKHSLVFWAGLFLFVQVAAGYGIEQSSLDNQMDQFFAQRVRFHHPLEERRRMMWGEAEKGFLAGEIMVIIDENRFQVRDPHEKEWTVLITPQTRLHPELKILPGQKIRLLGSHAPEWMFHAIDIRPWRCDHEPKKMFFQKHPPFLDPDKKKPGFPMQE